MAPWDFVLWSFACKEHLRIVYSLGHEWLRAYFLGTCVTRIVFKRQLLPLGVAIANFVESPPICFSGLPERLVACTSEFISILVCPWESASPPNVRNGTWLSIPVRSFHKMAQSFYIPINLDQRSLSCFQVVEFLPGGFLAREIYANYIYALAQASMTNTQKALAAYDENRPLSRPSSALSVRVLPGSPIIYNLANLVSLYRLLTISKEYVFPDVIHPVYSDVYYAMSILFDPGRSHDTSNLNPFNFLLTFAAPLRMHDMTHQIYPWHVAGSETVKHDAVVSATESGNDVIHLELDKLEIMHFKCVVNDAVERMVHAFFPNVYGGHYCGTAGVSQPHMLESTAHNVINTTLGLDDEVIEID